MAALKVVLFSFFFISLFFSLFSFTVSHDTPFDSHLLPRPLIIEYTETTETQFREFEEEVKLQCTSWRFAVETNNLSPWKTIPHECKDFVRDYMTGRGYKIDLERVNNESGIYAKSLELSGDGKDVWIFDIDETLLSNLPYYAEHGYGLEIFDHLAFDEWIDKAVALAIESSLKFYKEVLDIPL